MDDPNTDNLIGYKMNDEKNSLYEDKSLFRDTAVVFKLNGDILLMITDYDFIKP